MTVFMNGVMFLTVNYTVSSDRAATVTGTLAFQDVYLFFIFLIVCVSVRVKREL